MVVQRKQHVLTIVSSFPNRDGTVLAAGGQHTAALASMPRDGQDRLLVALEYLEIVGNIWNEIFGIFGKFGTFGIFGIFGMIEYLERNIWNIWNICSISRVL